MTAFSKQAFCHSSSGKRLTKQMGKHLDILDGKEVNMYENGSGGCGLIEYEVGGEPYELWPVMPEWCEEVQNETD